jgi:hypothetical protein
MGGCMDGGEDDVCTDDLGGYLMDEYEDDVCRDDLGGYLNNSMIQISLH